MANRRLVLTGDDLEAGLLFSPHSVVRQTLPEHSDMPMAVMRAMEEAREATAAPPHAGIPFRVVAVELPYVVSLRVLPDGNQDGPHIFDTRRTRLMRLSQGYIDSILAAGEDLVKQARERSHEERSEEGPEYGDSFSSRKARVLHERRRRRRALSEGIPNPIDFQQLVPSEFDEDASPCKVGRVRRCVRRFLRLWRRCRFPSFSLLVKRGAVHGDGSALDPTGSSRV